MKKDIRGQHGAVCWGELTTADPQAAATFYGEIFGWTAQEAEMADGSGTYTCFTNPSGEEVAGAMKPMAPGIPNNWGLHIHVDDVDAAAATTEKLGGKILMPPFDCPEAGRIAYLADPQGAHFAIIKLAKPI
ncbi:MAG: VOC family protein [Akkermansiaceae bacterium]